MRRFAANYIFPIESKPLKNGIIEVDNSGEILNIIDTHGNLTESRNLEFYNGVIVPGFINSHCHLELSELKGKFEGVKSLPQFLQKVVDYKKQQHSKNTLDAVSVYNDIMHANGIVAVGDISNTNITIQTKQKSKIYYHTFIELLGLNKNANDNFERGKVLFNEFTENNLNTSIVPHAPYSVSPELFKLICEFAQEKDAIISIHNQETLAEAELFIENKGSLIDTFVSMGIDKKNIPYTGKNSIESVVDFFPKSNNVLFVHNLYSTKKDVELIARSLPKSYWCLCPLSNLFIENKLPDVNLFSEHFDRVILGTDSLASNHFLSILEEMKVLVKEYSFLRFDEIIRWATINGAKALGIDLKYGSLKIGKKPGINLITGFDFAKMQITEKSEIKVLV